MNGRTILEVKRSLLGHEQVFSCQAISLTKDSAIISFKSPQMPLWDLPKDTITLAFFWRDRNYNLYRFISPDGKPIGYRFDVITDVRISDNRIEYLDLLLDLRVDRQGFPLFEDEDQVEECARNGLLSADRLAIIHQTRERLLVNHPMIIEEALTSLKDTAFH